LVLFFALDGLFFSGCKDENELGLEILPPGDALNSVFSDTLTINTRTLLEDSLRTDELSAQLLGSEKDPVFGLSTASVYTQVNLAGTPSFGSNFVVADSLVLILSYSGFYGDTNALQTVNVYRLSEDMRSDSSYFSYRTFSYDPALIGTTTFLPQPNSEVPVADDTLSPQLRITFSNTTDGKKLADSLIALNGHSQFSSNSEWLNYFKGLYLETANATGPGSISYFNFFKSSLTLYFHDTDLVSKKYDFSLAGARLNHFYHDYAGSTVGNQLSDSTFEDDSLNYVQAIAGVKMKISFPFLKHFVDSGSIIINKAQLSIKPLTSLIPYSLPPKMLLVIKDENGQNAFPLDYYESTGYYGGDLNSTSDGYTFNIARHLQRFIDGKVDNADFYLLVSGSGVDASRATIRSGSNLTDRMKLSLLYTKIN
jgi:hypothetical protein